MKVTKILAALLVVWMPSISSANCEFYNGHSQQLININIPPTLSIPRDAPNNSVLYESAPQTFNGAASYKCSSDFKKGVKNNLGGDSPTSTVFPIGTSGLSWQWIVDGTRHGGFGSSTGKAGGYGFNGTTHSLRIIKTGNITSGTTLTAGIMGFIQRGAIQPLVMTITNSSSIVLQSCETPDVKVEMKEHNLSLFKSFESYTTPKTFSIKLNNCPSGISKVAYSLSANPMAPAWNPALGIVELNKSSTAKGIALQVLDSKLEPIQLDKTYIFSEYASSGGNFSIPMNARYIRTLPSGSAGQYDPGMSAGTANTEVTFIMSYL
ncbi:fimbrial protein [Pseudomonas sp. OTU5201]|uniref:fimbrial protein n=1 Tax=Pseudomonas sp. OTU5201 TaxID=3043850 RepID=UPI00313E8788